MNVDGNSFRNHRALFCEPWDGTYPIFQSTKQYPDNSKTKTIDRSRDTRYKDNEISVSTILPPSIRDASHRQSQWTRIPNTDSLRCDSDNILSRISSARRTQSDTNPSRFRDSTRPTDVEIDLHAGMDESTSGCLCVNGREFVGGPDRVQSSLGVFKVAAKFAYKRGAQ